LQYPHINNLEQVTAERLLQFKLPVKSLKFKPQ
jgi:hypothetical protein